MKLSTVLLAILPTAIAAPTTTPTSMTVKNFTRVFPNASTGVYNFIIDYQFGTQNCTVTDSAANANTHSWYGIGCTENPSTWQISWGWNVPGNFTVMTVVDEPNQYEAFFGYSMPNSETSYPAVGPNAVQHT